MGKKRETPNQPMTNLLQKAAVAQMGPQIGEEIQNQVRLVKAETMLILDGISTRLAALETLLVEKVGIKGEEVVARIADIEDVREGYRTAESVQAGDRVRLQIQAGDEPSFKRKIDSFGSGLGLAQGLEDLIIGMKSGESRSLTFQDTPVNVTVDRVSRQAVQQGA